MRGGVDHEWHNFYDDTKLAALYGGTWEELPQGTFLRAGGMGGTTKSGTVTDGGSNTITLKEENLPNMYGYLARKNDNTITEGFGDSGALLPNDVLNNYGNAGRGWYKTFNTNEAYPAGLSRGGDQPFDNQPLYKNCHIWRRIS